MGWGRDRDGIKEKKKAGGGGGCREGEIETPWDLMLNKLNNCHCDSSNGCRYGRDANIYAFEMRTCTLEYCNILCASGWGGPSIFFSLLLKLINRYR